MSGRGKRENYGKGRVDPNAVHMGGKDKGTNKRRALLKSLLQKQKADKKGKRQSSKQESDKVAKETSLTKYKSKIKVQIKHGKLKTKNILNGTGAWSIEHRQETANNKQ